MSNEAAQVLLPAQLWQSRVKPNVIASRFNRFPSGLSREKSITAIFSRSNRASKFRDILDTSAEALGRSGRTQTNLFVPCELVTLQKVYAETCTSCRVRAPISAEPTQEEDQLCPLQRAVCMPDTFQKHLTALLQQEWVKQPRLPLVLLTANTATTAFYLFFLTFCALGHVLMVTRQQQKYLHM